MISKIKQAFTLIELLIVIAIIGILASVVIVSLGSQTDKASAGVVQNTLGQIGRTVAANMSVKVVAGDCFTGAASGGVPPEWVSIQAPAKNVFVQCKTAATGAWAIYGYRDTTAAVAPTPANYASYLTSTNGASCIDSTGVSKTNTGATAWAPTVTATACV